MGKFLNISTATDGGAATTNAPAQLPGQGGALSGDQKMQVAHAALDTIGEVIKVFSAYTNLQAKRTEWMAKVRVAELDLAKAEAQAQAASAGTLAQHRQLDLAEKALERLLAFFDEFMEQRKQLVLSSSDAAEVDEKLFRVSSNLIEALKHAKT